ncbi:MAG: acetamidase/formamidase family protein [Acidobacteriota bacterium]|nr:acetamidase/formamidase family protein [Acidobacteriota bacterium]
MDPGAAPVKGFFCADYEPQQSVAPGESVSFHAFNARWHWEPGDDPERPEGSGHALAGPFEVRGAKAGRTLVVRIGEVTPRTWGETFAGGERFAWTLEGGRWACGAHRVASAPFLGVIGMPPPEPGEHSTIPPRRWGGNIDCKLLVAGTTLYLPIPVDGALLMAGDCHGAQGDGEVSGTAIEAPLERATLTLDVADLELRMPIARVDGAWVAFGFDEDLDAAAAQATETMLDVIERELALSRKEALALASVAVDLHVTQVVNIAKGVHAILPDDAYR